MNLIPDTRWFLIEKTKNVIDRLYQSLQDKQNWNIQELNCSDSGLSVKTPPGCIRVTTEKKGAETKLKVIPEPKDPATGVKEKASLEETRDNVSEKIKRLFTWKRYPDKQDISFKVPLPFPKAKLELKCAVEYAPVPDEIKSWGTPRNKAQPERFQETPQESGILGAVLIASDAARKISERTFQWGEARYVEIYAGFRSYGDRNTFVCLWTEVKRGKTKFGTEEERIKKGRKHIYEIREFLTSVGGDKNSDRKQAGEDPPNRNNYDDATSFWTAVRKWYKPRADDMTLKALAEKIGESYDTTRKRVKRSMFRDHGVG